MRNLLVLISVLALYISSCGKEEVIIPEEPCKKYCDTLPDHLIKWESSVLEMDSFRSYYSSVPHLINDKVIYASCNLGTDETSKIYAVDARSGEMIWASLPYNAILTRDLYFVRNKGNLFVLENGRLVVLNASSGEVVKTSKAANPAITAIFGSEDDYIYFQRGTSTNKVYLNQWNLKTGEEDTIFSADTLYYNYHPYKLHINRLDVVEDLYGDRIAYITAWGQTVDTSEISSNFLLALNLSKKDGNGYERVWKAITLLPDYFDFNRSAQLLKYNNELLIFPGSRNILCVKSKSGTLRWADRIGGGISRTTPLIVKNELVFVSRNDRIVVVDLDNGTKYYSSRIAGMAKHMESRNGIVYIMTHVGYLYAFDLSEKKILWSYTSPNIRKPQYGRFGPGFTIDEKGEYLYTTDGVSNFCIKLNPE